MNSLADDYFTLFTNRPELVWAGEVSALCPGSVEMDVVMVDLVTHLFHGQVYTHYTPFTLLWGPVGPRPEMCGFDYSASRFKPSEFQVLY